MQFSELRRIGVDRTMASGLVAMTAQQLAVNEDGGHGKVVRQSPRSTPCSRADVQIERVAKGFVFTEGPMWHQGALWFSDLRGNKMYSLSADGRLRAMSDKAGGLDSFAAGTYGGSNAMVADRDGTVLMMQHGLRRIVRRLDDKLRHAVPDRIRRQAVQQPKRPRLRAGRLAVFHRSAVWLVQSGDAERRS